MRLFYARLFVENYEKLILQGEKADPENIVISCTYNLSYKNKDGKSYFFNNTKQTYVVSDALNEEKSTKEFWGKSQESRNFFPEIINLVDAAFVFGNYTYLINSTQFIKYKNDNYILESGSPNKFDFYSLLE